MRDNKRQSIKQISLLCYIIIMSLCLLGCTVSENLSKDKQSETTETSDRSVNAPTDTPGDTTGVPTPHNTTAPTSVPMDTITPAPTSSPTPTPEPIPDNVIRSNTPTPTPKPKNYTGKLDWHEENFLVYYVVNINTYKFHKTGCRHIRQMYEENTNYATDHGFASLQDARNWLIDQGFSPCGTCHP